MSFHFFLLDLFVDILIATPGRLLQHMDETALFNADNLKILVLDEADRILDMGNYFEELFWAGII